MRKNGSRLAMRVQECVAMSHHQSLAHDERILQALLHLTRGTARDCPEELSTEDPNAVEPPPDSELRDQVPNPNRWDVFVRSRPPRK